MRQSAMTRAILYGVVAGLRSSAPLVGCTRSASSWEWYLFFGEIAADKLPDVPARVLPWPAAARVVSAAYATWKDIAPTHNDRAQSIACAGATALLATRLAYELRTRCTARGGLISSLAATLEDVLALTCIVRLRSTWGIEHDG